LWHEVLTYAGHQKNKIMNTSEELIDLLNGLVTINNDRVAGYETAAKETEDFDLKALFTSMSNDSRKFSSELAVEVAHLGGKVATGTYTSGDLYRIWMDVKAALTGNDRKAILNSCETGEDVAQKAYNDALTDDVELSSELRLKILRQRDKMKIALDEIKMLRDTVAA